MIRMKEFTTKHVRFRGFTSSETFLKDVADEKRVRPLTGFTLIEAMIAVTILTLAVSGPLFTAGRAILAANVSRDQLTASYLAQEGVEYVRAMRDDEYLAAYHVGGPTVSGTAWNNFLTGSTPGSITQCRSTSCTLDPTQPMGYGSGYALAAYSAPAPLYLTNCASGCTPPNVYTQQNLSGSLKTPFTRTVQAEAVTGAAVDANGNPVDVRIVSTVSWDSHGTPYQVTVTDHLTPWQ